MDLTEEAQRILIELSRREAPSEACGILSQDTIRLMKNVSPTPSRAFICAGVGKTVLHNKNGYLTDTLQGYAIWHSHPGSRAVPTPEDIDLMRETLVPMVIVSLLPTVPEVAIFALDEDNADRVICVRSYRPIQNLLSMT